MKKICVWFMGVLILIMSFFLVVDGLLFCNLSCLTFFRGLQERERGCDSL